MGQIIKSLLSFCLSVSYGRNFDSILMKFCTVIWGPKSKIEFVWDKKLLTPSLILPQFLKIVLQPMGTSKRYSSVPVKDNCALFVPTPYFRVQTIRWCHLSFPSADPCCHGEFWDKNDYNSASVKDNRAVFVPISLYAAARVHSVAVGQIPRSKERISSLT